MPATATPPLENFGLTDLIEAAGGPHKRHRSASAMSDATSAVMGAGAMELAGRHGCIETSYWLPPADLKRDLNTAAPTAGGNLVASDKLAALVGAARPASVLERSGALSITVPGGSAEAGAFVWPSLQDSTEADWVIEGQAVPPANFTVGAATASPHLIGARQGLSRRLVKQSTQPLEPAMISELDRSIRATSEAGFWAGSNQQGQPLGITNLPSVQAVPFAGSSPTFSEVIDCVDQYLDEEGDFERLTFYCHPKTLVAMMKTEVASGSGNFLAACVHGVRSISLAGVPIFASSGIPQGKLIALDPSRIAVIRWAAPQLLIDRFSGGKSITGNVETIVLDAVDVIAARPSEIVIGS
jgi:HK97 family phage major capsid protein